MKGNGVASRGDLPAAVALFTQALELPLPRGRHLLFANRSAVRLQMVRCGVAALTASAWR
jgi:hypothetical protein